MIIGLTGPTGSGKSSLSKKAKDLGFKVVDCDILARKATQEGSEGLNALCLAFGDDILNDDKSLNRAKLAKIAFSSKENTELLNKTILPYIVKLVEAEIDCDRVLLDAPTLFESKVDSLCDKTIAVLASEEIRLLRIIARDGITKEAALLRIKAGKPAIYYEEKCDFIIFNNGIEAEFIAEFQEIINSII